MTVTQDFQERIGRIEGLVQKLESAADPAMRRIARELIESLMELHGAAFERVLQIVSKAQEPNQSLVDSFAADQLVGSLLVLYDLHPDDFETRVRRGIDNVRPVLRSQGVRVDQIEIVGNTVRVKLVGAGKSDLQGAIREALLETAPDASDVTIDGGAPVEHASAFVPISSLRGSNGRPVSVNGTGAA